MDYLLSSLSISFHSIEPPYWGLFVYLGMIKFTPNAAKKSTYQERLIRNFRICFIKCFYHVKRNGRGNGALIIVPSNNGMRFTWSEDYIKQNTRTSSNTNIYIGTQNQINGTNYLRSKGY